MKFNKRTKAVQYGTHRVRKLLAVLPVRVRDSKVESVWLETYYKLEFYGDLGWAQVCNYPLHTSLVDMFSVRRATEKNLELYCSDHHDIG